MLTVVAVLAIWTAGSMAMALIVGGTIRLREHTAHHLSETGVTFAGATSREARHAAPAPVG